MSTHFAVPVRTGFVDGSIDPLLARLYHTRTRFESQDRENEDTRRSLCEDMTEVLKISDKSVEREMVVDILLSLLKKADVTLKCALADRLSVLPNVPLRLVLQMIGEGITVATPVLLYSDALNDLDLLYIIQSRDAGYWRAIASREQIGENVVDALVETKDYTTVENLVDNHTVLFSPYALRGVEKLAQDNSFLAEKALTLPNIPAELAHKLYVYAGKAIQSALEQEYGTLSRDVIADIEDVVGEFATQPYAMLVPSAAMVRAADMFMRQNKLASPLMLRTLNRGQVASFVAQFSAFLGLPVGVVLAMFDQKERKGLSIALRASGFSRQDFITILRLTSHLPQKTALTSDDISAAVKYFDGISQKAAARFLKRSRN
ncbi:MAG: DUF2336 domain-containing protein [Pseudomonadota bacterium]